MATPRSAAHRIILAGAALVAVTLVAPSSGAVASSVATGSPDRAAAAGGVITDITLTTSANTLNWPDKVSIGGVATQSDGSPAAGASVQLWAQQVHTSYFRVSSFTTDSAGRLFATRRPESRTTYQWRVATSSVVSPTRTVKVRPALTIKGSSGQVPLGSKLIVSGASSPTRFHGPIKLQRKIGTHWTTVDHSRFTRAVTTKKPSAPYHFAVTAHTVGKRSFRTVVPADDGRLRAVSAVLHVRFVR